MRRKPLLIQVNQIQPDGSGRIKTMRVDELKSDFTPRSVLTDDQKRRLEVVFDAIGHYLEGENRADWVETQNCNAHPEREVEVREKIVRAWMAMGGGRKAFKVILAVSIGIVDISAQHNVTDEYVAKCRAVYEAAGEH